MAVSMLFNVFKAKINFKFGYKYYFFRKRYSPWWNPKSFQVIMRIPIRWMCPNGLPFWIALFTGHGTVTAVPVFL